MELKIVDFIKTHSNWEELLTSSPYNLTIKRDGKLILFKYNQINSDFNEEICCEARGLILEEGTWKVVRMAFKKFFNLGESFAAKIDWDSAVASEKLDGSIISVFYYDGKWRIATNSTIDAFKAELAGVGPYKNFGELFESVLPLSTFAGNRYENICWTFEIVSPYNKVVIDYPETKVYLLSVRFMNTLEELDYDQIPVYAGKIGVAYPQFYYMNDETGFRRLVEQMPEGHEGIVVRDAAGQRVKIKTLLYFQMHKAKNNGVITLERIVDLIRANDHYEFLSYFPEYQPIFDDVKRQIDHSEAVLEKVRQDVAEWKNNNKNVCEQDARMARKWFAQDLGKKGPLYFAEYDGKLANTVNSLETKKFISLFKIELKEG